MYFKTPCVSSNGEQLWVTGFTLPKSVSIVVQYATLSVVSMDLKVYTHEQTNREQKSRVSRLGQGAEQRTILLQFQHTA